MIASALLLAGCGESSYPVRTYQMGEKVPLGHLIYTVFETQWLTQIGTGINARVPQNRFFLVRISAVNSSGQTLTVPNLYVEDDKGTQYRNSATATACRSGSATFAAPLRRKLPPATWYSIVPPATTSCTSQTKTITTLPGWISR